MLYWKENFKHWKIFDLNRVLLQTVHKKINSIPFPYCPPSIFCLGFLLKLDSTEVITKHIAQKVLSFRQLSFPFGFYEVQLILIWKAVKETVFIHSWDFVSLLNIPGGIHKDSLCFVNWLLFTKTTPQDYTAWALATVGQWSLRLQRPACLPVQSAVVKWRGRMVLEFWLLADLP